MNSKKRVECPTCRESFNLANWLKIGTQILCPNCEELLQVVKMNPTTVECVYSSNYYDDEDSTTW